MKDLRLTTISIILILSFQSRINSQDTPITIEAESGILGGDYIMTTEGDVDFVSIATDYINLSNPGSDERVITFTGITFPDTGSYDLFARLRVGPQGGNDDSFFTADTFGTLNSMQNEGWITVNQLDVSGFTGSSQVVKGNGAVGAGVWKWVNISDFTGGNRFILEPGAVTETFTYQIGARENGLDIDKLVFGKTNLYFTVSNLDNGEPGATEPPIQDTLGPPLADGLDKFLGCAYGPASMYQFENYWNQVTVEDGGKWGSVEATRDVMNWTVMDQAYDFAREHGFPFRHHVLIWGNQQPVWIAALDSTEQRAELEEWFAEVAARYDSIDQVEIVNEPLHDPPDDPEDGGYIGALGGTGETGWDWVIEAFRLARQYFPNSELLLNEYSVLNETVNAEDYLEIIELLKADTLIDAVGFQGHGFSIVNAASATLESNLEILASAEVPLYVTEMDVDGLDDGVQLRSYQRIFPIFWEHPLVRGVTLWGFRPAMWRGAQGCYLITNEGVERPSMTWLRAYLNGTYIPAESISITSEDNRTYIDTDSGTLQLWAELSPADATIQDVSWSVSPAGLASIDQNDLLTALDNGTVTVTARSIEYETLAEATVNIDISNQVTGLEEFLVTEVKVYPNPSDDLLFLSISNNHGVIVKAEIIDMTGEILYELQLNTDKPIDVSMLQKGIYLIRIELENRTIFEKVVIE